VSAIWSLLAVVARRDLKQGAPWFGILHGLPGLGGVLGAKKPAPHPPRFYRGRVFSGPTLFQRSGLLVFWVVRWPFLVIAALVLSGIAWTSTMSTINVSVQLAVPAWVQARALGTYMMTFQGGMALGSVLWGYIAEHTKTPIALACSAGGLLLTFPFVR